jgi:peroxiredoxin
MLSAINNKGEITMNKLFTTAITSILALSAMASSALAELKVGDAVPADTVLTDSNGKTHKIGDFAGKVAVLEWTNYSCPFVRKHYDSGNMQKLQAETTAKGAVWLSVNSSAEGKQGHLTSTTAAAAMAKESAKPTAMILDADGSLGKMFGASTTPHMFVLDAAGKVAYAGAIDSIPSFSKDDVAKAENYVVKAVDELQAGKPVSTAQTTPYGCSVKY